ncbi:MAG: 8-oxo-dGTP diphosphatase, partial [Candidatus Omnitrophica bacterium]|nr:8-oxo-dGTP diphosphatase [Candidatus Omnitrophota bacterium]
HLGKWNGLGGKLEPGESPEECVIREVFEESGLRLIEPEFRGILTWPKFDGVEDWLAFVFAGEKFTGTLKDSSAEGDLRWVREADLFDLELWEGDRIFLKWFLEGRFFSGKFIYEDGKLVDHQVVFHEVAPRE